MFTFSSVDLLNAKIRGPGGISYRTKTSGGFRGRHATSLISMTGTEPRVVGGIDWREKAFVIEGKTWDLAELKSWLMGHSDSLCIWRWGGVNYKIDLYEKQWKLTKAEELESIATLNQSMCHIFKSNKPATIQFHSSELSDIDTIFFIFVMIHTEVEWQDDQLDYRSKDDPL